MQQETKSNIWQVFDTLCVWLFNLSGTWKIKEGQKKHEDTASRIIWGLWQDKWISHGKVRFPECVSLGNGNRGVCVRRVTSTQVTSQQQSDPAVSVLTALLITVRTEDGLGELFCMWGVSYRILTSHFTSLLFFSLSTQQSWSTALCSSCVSQLSAGNRETSDTNPRKRVFYFMQIHLQPGRKFNINHPQKKWEAGQVITQVKYILVHIYFQLGSSG